MKSKVYIEIGGGGGVTRVARIYSKSATFYLCYIDTYTFFQEKKIDGDKIWIIEKIRSILTVVYYGDYFIFN